MKTKLKRTKLKVILSIIIPMLLITGIIAVSVHAEKPDSPPGQAKKEPPAEPIWVSVSGAIEGLGNPYAISIEFLYDSFGENAGVFISNPDYPPSLKVTGPGVHKRLSYYYCDCEHSSGDSICTNPDLDGDDVGDHDPYCYKCLMISGGEKVKKIDQIVFPAGSGWRITQKIILPSGDWAGEVVAEGYLAEDVIYEVLEWGTP